MKRICLLAALCLCALLLLGGCGKKEEQADSPETTTTPEPTEAPTPTPEPTATPEPVPTVAVGSYQYETIENSNLQVSFQHPTHWTNDPGKYTICYIEPVNVGEVGARVAVSAKSVSRAPDTTSLKKQLASLMEQLAASYFSFTPSEDIQTDEAVFGTKGLSQTYTARDEEGNRVTGFVLMAYVSSNKRIYALHFSAPSGRYEELAPVLSTIRQSLTAAK